MNRVIMLEELLTIKAHVKALIASIENEDKEDKGEDKELWVFRPIEETKKGDRLIRYVATPMATVNPINCMHADNRQVADHLMSGNERREFKMWCGQGDVLSLRDSGVEFVLRHNAPAAPGGME